MADLGLHLDDLTHAHFRRHPGFGQTVFGRPLGVRTEFGVAALAGCIGDTAWGVFGEVQGMPGPRRGDGPIEQTPLAR